MWSTDKNPIVYMLSGPPCVGKSTWWRNQKGWCAQVISTDYWVECHAAQIGKTYNEVFHDYIKYAKRDMNTHLQRSMRDGDNIIWDQTNLTPKIRREKMARFAGTAYERVGVFFTGATLDLLLSRNTREGKIIPTNVLESMLNVYQIPEVCEPWFDRIEFVSAGVAPVIAKDLI